MRKLSSSSAEPRKAAAIGLRGEKARGEQREVEKEIENGSFLLSYDTVIQPSRFHSRLAVWRTRGVKSKCDRVDYSKFRSTALEWQARISAILCSSTFQFLSGSNLCSLFERRKKKRKEKNFAPSFYRLYYIATLRFTK